MLKPKITINSNTIAQIKMNRWDLKAKLPQCTFSYMRIAQDCAKSRLYI